MKVAGLVKSSIPVGNPNTGDKDQSVQLAAADLRAIGIAGFCWLGCLTVLVSPIWAIGLLLIWFWRQKLVAATWIAWLLVFLVAGYGAWISSSEVLMSPIRGLTKSVVSAEFEFQVTSDPVLKRGKFTDFVIFHANIKKTSFHGKTLIAEAPVVMFSEPIKAPVTLAGTYQASGRILATSAQDWDDPLRIVLSGSAKIIDPAPVWVRLSNQLRAAIRLSTQKLPPAVSGLIVSLVTGDEQGLSPETKADFKAAGLTHLTAVSGTNLTLILGFWLLVWRLIGVRRNGIKFLTWLGIIGFVILARPEPSVLRAAAMGMVGLYALHDRSAGVRALGWGTTGLLWFRPDLAVSAGFALSVLATAGILLFAPNWKEKITGWAPNWLAEMIAIPLAAQLACTPLLIALSGKVSVGAIFANLLAAVAVGPTTVLALMAGVLCLVFPPIGQFVCWFAGLGAAWLLLVAKVIANLPGTSRSWSASWFGLITMSLLILFIFYRFPIWLRSKRFFSSVATGLAISLFVPTPVLGWPPQNWIMVACDVGQGDALILKSSGNQVVVVDVGPDSALLAGCLARLGNPKIAALILTHFHRDHVAGLAGALAGGNVAEIWVTSLPEPEAEAQEVYRLAAAADTPVKVISGTESGKIGELSWRFLGPPDPIPANSNSRPNDASIVMLAELFGVRLLLQGDQEEPAQTVLLKNWVSAGGVDVLKVAHHGSSNQNYPLLSLLQPKLAVISVGADNDYGHPAPKLLAALAAMRTFVLRTDQVGEIALTITTDGQLAWLGRDFD